MLQLENYKYFNTENKKNFLELLRKYKQVLVNIGSCVYFIDHQTIQNVISTISIKINKKVFFNEK